MGQHFVDTDISPDDDEFDYDTSGVKVDTEVLVPDVPF